MSTVYLLHISPPFKHAKHYVGVTRKRDFVRRWLEHMNKEGANLTRHARRAGCQLILARIWVGADFGFETSIKARGKAKLCPICRKARSGK